MREMHTPEIKTQMPHQSEPSEYFDPEPFVVLFLSDFVDIQIEIDFNQPNSIETKIGWGNSDNYYIFGNDTHLHNPL